MDYSQIKVNDVLHLQNEMEQKIVEAIKEFEDLSGVGVVDVEIGIVGSWESGVPLWQVESEIELKRPVKKWQYNGLNQIEQSRFEQGEHQRKVSRSPGISLIDGSKVKVTDPVYCGYCNAEIDRVGVACPSCNRITIRLQESIEVSEDANL